MKARELLRMTRDELIEYFKSNKNQKHLYLYNIECPEIHLDPPSENYAITRSKVIKKTGLVIIFTSRYSRTIGYIGNNTIININGSGNGKRTIDRIVILCPDKDMTLYFDDKEDLSGIVMKED